MTRLSIRTFTGRDVDLQDIRPEDIKIEDIAHSLSLQCRFIGHTNQFYSVAEHSLNLSLLVPPLYRTYVILHDAHEAYFGDIPTPLKNMIITNWPGYNDLIIQCDKAIMTALKLDHSQFIYVKSIIKDVEAQLFNLEMNVLKYRKSVQLEPDHPLTGAEWGMIPTEIEKTFLSIYKLLSE